MTAIALRRQQSAQAPPSATHENVIKHSRFLQCETARRELTPRRGGGSHEGDPAGGCAGSLASENHETSRLQECRFRSTDRRQRRRDLDDGRSQGRCLLAERVSPLKGQPSRAQATLRRVFCIPRSLRRRCCKRKTTCSDDFYVRYEREKPVEVERRASAGARAPVSWPLVA